LFLWPDYVGICQRSIGRAREYRCEFFGYGSSSNSKWSRAIRGRPSLPKRRLINAEAKAAYFQTLRAEVPEIDEDRDSQRGEASGARQSRPRIENNGRMSEPNIASNFDRLALRKNNLSCRLHRLESPMFFMTGGKFISRLERHCCWVWALQSVKSGM
jgi:hypothetical protein